MCGVTRRRTFQLKQTVLSVAVIMSGIGLATLSAKDWPQWRGAERLGLWTETGIVQSFPAQGLTVKWRLPIHAGYAGPAVADGRVFVLDYLEDPDSRTMDGTERILALSEETGEVLWTHEWPTTYRMLMFTYATGPRATPTVDDNRVYIAGATGMIFCLDKKTALRITTPTSQFGARQARR